jgi:hypothetical protein
MKWWRVVLLVLLLCPVFARAQSPVPISGFCLNGAQPAITSGLPSSNFLQGLIPRCTVTVVLSGTTTPATLYSDSNSTPLTNPFTANADASWSFFVAPSSTQIYSVVLSGGVPPNVYIAPRTLTNVATAGGSGGTFIGDNIVTKLPQVNITHPDFGVNMPIGTLTLGGNLACTSTPTGTISAPVNTTIGVQATVTLACANSLVVITDWFNGAGYDNTATATISGGGTSGATLTIGYSCIAGIAGNGLQSSCAIQQAVNWTGNVFGHNGGPFPCVFLPPGNYLTDMTIRVPAVVQVCGSGINVTSLQATQPHNSIMSVANNGWSTPANVVGFGTGGSLDGITFTTQLRGVLGVPFASTIPLAGTVTTSGTTVSYVSGQNFSGLTNGTYITINGVPYTIATVTSTTVLVLMSPAGTQANVAYSASVYTGYDATFLEVNNPHNSISNVQFINGGGRGITLNSTDEEMQLNNIWFNEVRWPLDGMGQARDNVQNIFEANAGAALSTINGSYCFAAQCVNGIWYSQSWTATSATVASATADGHGGATFVINCVPASTCYNGYPSNAGTGTQTSAPITVGQWFHIAGITDPNYVALNGDFRATAISGAVGSPFTVTTAAGPYPDSGTVSGGQFDYGNDQSLVIRGATLQIPAAGSPSSVATATFQIDAAPPQNAAYTGGGPGNTLFSFRCSTVWWANCYQGGGGVSMAEGGYVEFFSIGGTPGMSSAIRVPGYLPHTALTQPFNGSGCSPNAPCYATLTSTIWFQAHMQVVGQHVQDLQRSQNTFSLMPQDYCPQCTGQPSAFVPGVNRDQYEVIMMAAYGTTGGAVTARNVGGTTAPANTAWPVGTVVGNNRGSTFIGGDDSISIKAIHTSGVAANTSTLFHAVVNDQTAVLSADYVMGVLYDGWTLVPLPQTGEFGGGPQVIMEDVTGTNCGANAGGITIGAGCIKATRGNVTFNDSAFNFADKTSEGPAAAAGIIPNGFDQGAIAINYNETFHGTANVSSATNSSVTNTGGGLGFACIIAGDPITINGTVYTVATNNLSSLTLTTNAGAQTGVPWSFTAPCSAGASFSNPTRPARYSYNTANNARNQGIFSGDTWGEFQIGKNGVIPLPGLDYFNGRQNANGFAITDINGAPITVHITSWAFTAPGTVTFQAANTLNTGNCVVITGLVVGAMFNTPYGQCIGVGSPTSSSFTLNYLPILPAFPPLSVPSGATETGLATQNKFGIMWYIEGGPFFTGANVCEVVTFPFGVAGTTQTPAVKNCATATPGVYTSLFTANDFPVMANWPNTVADSSSTVNALVATTFVSWGLTNPLDGARITILPAFTNTNTTPSLTVDGGTGHTIRRLGGGPLVAGDLNTDTWASVVYSAATGFWILQNPRVSGIQTTLYSAAGTPLPTCSGGLHGQQLVVSDATAPTFNGAYVSGGAVIAAVMCGTTGWVTY